MKQSTELDDISKKRLDGRLMKKKEKKRSKMLYTTKDNRFALISLRVWGFGKGVGEVIQRRHVIAVDFATARPDALAHVVALCRATCAPLIQIENFSCLPQMVASGAIAARQPPRLARSCWGRRMAAMEVKTILSMLIWHFEMLEIPAALSGYAGFDGVSRRPQKCFVRLRRARA